jgi:nitrile hydratase
MSPVSYLTEPYFIKWCLNDLAHAVDQDMFTLDEVVTGASATAAPAAETRSVEELAENFRAGTVNFSREIDELPRFGIGDRVCATRWPSEGHTRLPAYARGAWGTILTDHGGHLFPDAGALGRHEVQHLYTVEFSAFQLWGPGASEIDTVCLDLWESYLEAE